jgi:hypothetical protein
MSTYKVVLLKQDSKGKDRIIDVQLFEDRKDADNFINQSQAKPMVYRTEPETLYYEFS